MTTNDRHHSHLKVDVASLLLLVSGLLSGALALWLTTQMGVTGLVIIPSVVASTIGATHLVKREVPRHKR